MSDLIPDTRLRNSMEPNSVHSSLLSAKLPRLTPAKVPIEMGLIVCVANIHRDGVNCVCG